MTWQSEDEFETAVEVKAAFLDAEEGQVTLTVQWGQESEAGRWEQGGITDEVVGTTDLSCTHRDLNLDESMKGTRIRVYWLREKTWFVGSVTRFNSDKNLHEVTFDDGDVEEYDLLEPEKKRPAWETEPFTGDNNNTGDRFGF